MDLQSSTYSIAVVVVLVVVVVVLVVVVVVVFAVWWEGRISRKRRCPHQTVSNSVVLFSEEYAFPARRQIR